MPVSNITHLRGLAFAPDPAIIRELESLLAAARRGEVLGFAGVVEYPGQWRAVAVGAVQRDCGPYIGWVEILQQEMVDVHRATMGSGVDTSTSTNASENANTTAADVNTELDDQQDDGDDDS